jgi:hypothetical protein
MLITNKTNYEVFMKKIHADKIRATFYIDKRLYQLLKRCSSIEGIPMSSIIDNDILSARVGKYEFQSPEAWERHEYVTNWEASEREEQEDYEAYASSPEGLYEAAKLLIQKKLSDAAITDEQATRSLIEAEKKYKQELELEEKEKQQFKERWEKAVKEIPIE